MKFPQFNLRVMRNHAKMLTNTSCSCNSLHRQVCSTYLTLVIYYNSTEQILSFKVYSVAQFSFNSIAEACLVSNSNQCQNEFNSDQKIYLFFPGVVDWFSRRRRRLTLLRLHSTRCLVLLPYNLAPGRLLRFWGLKVWR